MRESLRLAFILAAVATAAAAAAADTVRAARVAPIAVDGAIADWKDVPVQYLDTGPRVTAIAHDGRFLYVQFRFSDLTLARRVLRSGATVWVDGAGGHDASYGLRYRGNAAAEAALRQAESAGGETGGPDGAPPPGRGPDLARAPLGALEVLRLGVVDEVIESGAAPDGPAAACAVVDGVFAFELRAPLADLARNGVATGAGAVAGSPARIAVGFQMGGMTRAERDAARERMHAGGRPGGGPPAGIGGGGFAGHGGPPGGGGPGGGPGDRGGGWSGRERGGETVWVDVELPGAPPRSDEQQ